VVVREGAERRLRLFREETMTENEWGSGEENMDESGRNPTQLRVDEGEGGDRPVDLEQDIEENEPSSHEGEEGQDIA
jgi:hypothetical protein